MMPNKTHRMWNYQTVATIVASITVGAGALALASDSSGVKPKDGKAVELGKDRVQKPASDVKRVKSKAVSDAVQLDRGASGTPTGQEKGNRRIALKPLDAQGKRTPNNNPYLVPAKELVTSEAAAYQLDPVTGIGLMVSPDGSPIFVKLRPSTASSGWIGSAMGDETSTAFIIETKYGPVGMLLSRVWGHFRFLPVGKGNVRITSTNPKEIGICGNGTEWELPHPEFNREIAMGGLAGGGVAGGTGNCWSDTEDQTVDGVPLWVLPPPDPKGPDGQSFTVNSANGLCSGQPVQELDTPDIPDWRYRDYACTGFPTINRVIDILFAYSQDTATDLGGAAAVHALAVAEIALLNECFENSRMGVRARLVGTELAMWANPDDNDGIENDPFTGSGSPPADLNRLVMEYWPNTNGLSNVMEVLRDERGADLVSLLVSNNNTGVAGIAFMIPMQEEGGMSGATAASAGCVSTLDAALSLTYQHEIGHLIGGCHAHPEAEIDGNDQYATCPCRAREGDEDPCLMTEPNAFPDEFHYGYRFWVEYDEVPPTEEDMMRSIMAYDDDNDPPLAQRQPYFSNPDVQVYLTSSDTGVVNDDLNCCEDDAENAANAWVMDYWISGINAGDANFANGGGIAQYRCRTIPYDCDQNGRLDTEEIDGIHPDGNEHGLTDEDGDRVADGCLPNQCLNDDNIDLSQDPLSGPGGTISDQSVFESVAVMPIPDPFGNSDDNAWAFQVMEIEIVGLLHPDVTQLEIALVHTPPLGGEDVFVLSNCSGVPAGAPTVLNGTYRFVTASSELAFQTLATPTLCEYAQNGSGGWIPAGNYQPDLPLTDDSWSNPDADPPLRRPENGSWTLRIVDHVLGGQGYFAGWNMTMAYLPYASDCDGDGLPDGCLFGEFELEVDCNQNGEADSCDIAADPLRLNDCDLNNVLDECEDTSFLLDCDENDIADLCDIRADPSKDVNNNGMIDDCEPGGGGDVFDCANRVFDSVGAGLTGPGFSTVDLGVASSTISVPAEPDDGTNDPVVPGAIVNGGVTVVLTDIQHSRLNDVELRLTHSANGISVTVELMPLDCGGTGYFESGTNRYTITDGGFITLCEQSNSGGPIPDDFDNVPPGDENPNPYAAEDDLGAFIGMSAAGTWTLEVFDIYLGASGSIGSWDLRFGHRPPDEDGDGVPDICEP